MATEWTGMVGEIKTAISIVASQALDNTTPQDNVNQLLKDSVAFGTGDDQCNEIWHDRRTLGAAANETLDLSGSLVNGLGHTVDFASVKLIFIHNRSDLQDTPTAAILKIGAAAGTQFDKWLGGATDVLTLTDGARMLYYSPNDGVDSSQGADDLLKIEETATLIAEYDIILIGISE